MSLFANAVFAISAEKLSDLPAPSGAEIVFAGRSNAGKSSAINTLVGMTRLAFVSKTPGRTQLINFFRLRNGAFLVDLPGYGYADVPEKVRRHWQSVLAAYLAQRSIICGLVLIMDARRPLTELDRQMLEWFGPTGKPIHILLTKADKLTRTEAAKVLQTTRSELAPWADQISVQLFSSLKKTGADEAEKVIGSWLGVVDQAPEKRNAPG
jgi:GTP-binding protein